jgi:hypothetical protein
MVRTLRAAARRFAIPAALSLSVSACAGVGWGTLGDVIAAGGVNGARELHGEVRAVDTRRQEIQLQSGFGTDRVRYDNRTEVVFGGRRYAVRDLSRGDLVRVRLEPNRRGDLYATRIQVQQSAQQRQGTGLPTARLQRVDGSVGRIDTRRGWFELHPTRGGAMLVTLPYEPTRATRDRFRRLRRGERIRVEGEMLNQARLELRRFL